MSARIYDALANSLIRGVEHRESMNARQAAEAIWYPGHPLKTVEAIEARIIQRRTEDAALLAAQTPNAA